MKTKTLISCLALATTLCVSQLSAQTLTPDDPSAPFKDDNSLTVGVANIQGYDIESNSTSIASLPLYVSSFSFGRYYSLSDSTHITLDGTSYQTGFTYNGATSYPTTLAYFTLGTVLPKSFTVSLLTDAAGPGFGTAVNTYFTAQVYDGGIYGTAEGSPITVNTTISTTRDHDNDFYNFTVSGLTAADSGKTIVISGSNPTGSFETLDGVAFSVPEPSTYALMLLGLAALSGIALRRNRA